jgi:hypothetical protein
MSSTDVTAPALGSHVMRTEVLDRALNARGSNLAQQRLLDARDTPAIDSLIEEILELRAHGVPHAVRQRLVNYWHQLCELNRLEGDDERAIAGVADRLTSQLRDRELNSGMRRELTVKEIARRLRPVLPILDMPQEHDSAAIVRAHRIFNEIAAAKPAAELLTGSVANQLRPTLFAQLQRVHASWSAAR